MNFLRGVTNESELTLRNAVAQFDAVSTLRALTDKEKTAQRDLQLAYKMVERATVLMRQAEEEYAATVCPECGYPAGTMGVLCSICNGPKAQEP